MPAQVLLDAKVWLAHWDISGKLNAVSLIQGADLKTCTTLGSTGTKRRGGLTTAALQVEGYWEDDVDAQLQAAFGVVDVPVTVAPSPTEGDPAFSFRAIEGEYTIGGQVGEVMPFSAGAQSSAGDPLMRGTLMHNATRNSTATGTARQLGAVGSTQRLYATLHVLAITGTLDVVVASDTSGFPSPTTRITFAQAAAVGSQWATPAAGPITDDWYRVGWTISGGGSATFVVTVGIK